MVQKGPGAKPATDDCLSYAKLTRPEAFATFLQDLTITTLARAAYRATQTRSAGLARRRGAAFGRRRGDGALTGNRGATAMATGCGLASGQKNKQWPQEQSHCQLGLTMPVSW